MRERDDLCTMMVHIDAMLAGPTSKINDMLSRYDEVVQDAQLHEQPCELVLRLNGPREDHAKRDQLACRFEFWARQHDVPIREELWTARCDLCGSTVDSIAWLYDSDDSVVDPGPESRYLGFQGDWASCEPCADLIELEAWDDLARRSAKNAMATHPEFLTIPFASIIEAISLGPHMAFRLGRTGARRMYSA